MTEKIIIAGAGGQGVMLLGKIITEAASAENKNVTWLPSYGAEVRGGTANCMVVVSDQDIGSPYIVKADTLIIMNEPSLEKFKPKLKKTGLLIINSSLIDKKIEDKNTRVKKGPFTYIAMKLGNLKVANMVALGFYLANKNIINIQTVFTIIDKIAPADKRGLIAINKQALEEGGKIKWPE